MSGILYVVGTPIGNLSDMTARAVDTLRAVDFIAAEDTRVTLKLLNHFDIKKPLVSYHKYSVNSVAENICNRILSGESCAVVTDAGMPCISDPGEELVKLAALSGIKTVPVPAASAVVTALAVSGLSTARFAFEGFLPVPKKQRKEALIRLKNDTHTLIFYEAPHKLKDTLADIYEAFGDRKISLCRELTKIHEEIIRTTLKEAVTLYDGDNAPRGEFVLVIEGAKETDEKCKITLDEAAEKAQTLIDGGMKPTEACKLIAKETGFSKGEIYGIISNNE